METHHSAGRVFQSFILDNELGLILKVRLSLQAHQSRSHVVGCVLRINTHTFLVSCFP